MENLTAFLLARIREDRRHASDVTTGPDGDQQPWRPRRIKDECDAKLEIIRVGTDEQVLRLLALPYADHPDYREEWKP